MTTDFEEYNFIQDKYVNLS